MLCRLLLSSQKHFFRSVFIVRHGTLSPGDRKLPSKSVVTMRLCTWSTAVYGWGGVCQVASIWLQWSKVSQRALHFWRDDHILFTSPVSGFNVVTDQCVLLCHTPLLFPKTIEKTSQHCGQGAALLWQTRGRIVDWSQANAVLDAECFLFHENSPQQLQYFLQFGPSPLWMTKLLNASAAATAVSRGIMFWGSKHNISRIPLR